MFAYIITNMINKKSYIGISYAIKRRFSDHKRAKSLLGNAIRKYGKENFEIKVLVEGSDQYIADLETPLILSFHTLHPNGYNLSLETHKSFKHHEESKAKMRKPKSDKTRENMSIAKKGKPNGRKNIFKHSEKTKISISESLKDISKSQEFKDKLTGRKLSDSHKNNISNGNLGKKQSISVCPHCNKSGGSQTMPRWHFDRCKFKENLE